VVLSLVRFDLRLGCVAAVLASSCVSDVPYEPFGTDVAMSGSWTVAGAPPTIESCGEIVEVRVVLLDAGTPFEYDELTFPCEQGQFQTDRIFLYGHYETEWQALDSSGRIIGRGQRQIVDVAAPAEVIALTAIDWQAG
jgi:hypothetical protein